MRGPKGRNSKLRAELSFREGKRALTPPGKGPGGALRSGALFFMLFMFSDELSCYEESYVHYQVYHFTHFCHICRSDYSVTAGSIIFLLYFLSPCPGPSGARGPWFIEPPEHLVSTSLLMCAHLMVTLIF